MKKINTVLDILDKIKSSYPTEQFRDKTFYADWLAQTYFFVCHSTALLGYSLPYLNNPSLRHHFEHHMTEENRHELLALKDLEKLGMSIDQFRESSFTQAFYQSQYYRIQFEGGTSLLGYILFLEGMAVGWGKEIFQETKGLFPSSVLFIKVHAEEDPHHLEAALKTIGSLSLNEQEAIWRNFWYSSDLYGQMIRSIACNRNLKLAS